jgi:hypothetical protein
MNLIDALKSGKRFRRAGEEFWLDTIQDWSFSLESVLADDWEVEEKGREITSDKFDYACSAAFFRTPLNLQHKSTLQIFINELKKELELGSTAELHFWLSKKPTTPLLQCKVAPVTKENINEALLTK